MFVKSVLCGMNRTGVSPRDRMAMMVKSSRYHAISVLDHSKRWRKDSVQKYGEIFAALELGFLAKLLMISSVKKARLSALESLCCVSRDGILYVTGSQEYPVRIFDEDVLSRPSVRVSPSLYPHIFHRSHHERLSEKHLCRGTSVRRRTTVTGQW